MSKIVKLQVYVNSTDRITCSLPNVTNGGAVFCFVRVFWGNNCTISTAGVNNYELKCHSYILQFGLGLQADGSVIGIVTLFHSKLQTGKRHTISAF